MIQEFWGDFSIGSFMILREWSEADFPNPIKCLRFREIRRTEGSIPDLQKKVLHVFAG
jgi:hypothetical protein